MKKIILAAAALVAGLAANAETVGFDFTIETACKDLADANNLFNDVDASATVTADDATKGKYTLASTAAGASVQVGGIKLVKDGNSDQTYTGTGTLAQTMAHRLDVKSKIRIIIPTNAGDVIQIKGETKTGGSSPFTATATGAQETSVTWAQNGTGTLTATGAEVTIIGTSTLKIEAITGSTATYTPNWYTTSTGTAVAEAAAAEKAQVAQIGLVKIFNDGSKEIAK